MRIQLFSGTSKVGEDLCWAALAFLTNFMFMSWLPFLSPVMATTLTARSLQLEKRLQWTLGRDMGSLDKVTHASRRTTRKELLRRVTCQARSEDQFVIFIYILWFLGEKPLAPCCDRHQKCASRHSMRCDMFTIYD